MEQFCFWNSGMWIFPMIGCCVMVFFCGAMLFFCRRRSGGSNVGHPFYRQWNCSEYPKEANYSETAIDVLNRRYANGEISKEEYECIKKDILS